MAHALAVTNDGSAASSPPPADDAAPQLPESSGDPSIPSIQLGETIRFEEWGPVILNKDGTMRRIANWENLSPQEQAVTWRRISKRNEERRVVLLEAQTQEAQQTEGASTDSPAGVDTTATPEL
jgi:hypothetical protein